MYVSLSYSCIQSIVPSTIDVYPQKKAMPLKSPRSGVEESRAFLSEGVQGRVEMAYLRQFPSAVLCC